MRSSVKEDIPDTDVALKRLREKYKEVCGKPFALPAEFDESVLADMDNLLELYPWEYSHEASNEREKKTITVASPALTRNCVLRTGATLGSSSFLIGPGRVGETTIVPSIPLVSGDGVATAVMEKSAITVAPTIEMCT